MSAPMSMNERIAQFNANKSTDTTTPEKSVTETAGATPVRRSSIADKIAALKAGGDKSSQPTPASTPSRSTASNINQSTPTNSLEHATEDNSGAKKLTVAEKIAAMKAANTPQQTPESAKPVSKWTPKTATPIATTVPVPTTNTDTTTPEQSNSLHSTEDAVTTIPHVREDALSGKHVPSENTTTATLSQSPCVKSEDQGHTTPIKHESAPVSTPKTETPTVTAAPPPTPADNTSSAATATTPSASTESNTTTPVRRSSIADRIAALKASGGEKPAVVLSQPAPSSTGKKLISPFKEASTATENGNTEGVTTATTETTTPVKVGRIGGKLNIPGGIVFQMPGQGPPPKKRVEISTDHENDGGDNELKRKSSQSENGVMNHANLTRATVSNDKRKRAVQSCRLQNVDWEKVAREEGMDIRGFSSLPSTPYNTTATGASLFFTRDENTLSTSNSTGSLTGDNEATTMTSESVTAAEPTLESISEGLEEMRLSEDQNDSTPLPQSSAVGMDVDLGSESV